MVDKKYSALKDLKEFSDEEDSDGDQFGHLFMEDLLGPSLDPEKEVKPNRNGMRVTEAMFEPVVYSVARTASDFGNIVHKRPSAMTSNMS